MTVAQLNKTTYELLDETFDNVEITFDESGNVTDAKRSRAGEAIAIAGAAGAVCVLAASQPSNAQGTAVQDMTNTVNSLQDITTAAIVIVLSVLAISTGYRIVKRVLP